MRILLVSQEYPPETAGGGIGSQNYAKAHGLAAKGHEVCVLSHSLDAERHQYVDGAVRVIRIPGADALLEVREEAVRWLAYSVQVASAIEALHAEWPLDLVEFPEWGCEGYVYLLNRGVDGDGPAVVIQLHGPLVMFAEAIGWPEVDSEFYRVASGMEGTCLRLADGIFSSSACSIDWCRERHGLAMEGVPVIHTGIDLQRFRPGVEERSGEPLILFVGKIERNKGVVDLVRAACRLAEGHPGLRLRLLGKGNENLRAELTAEAEKLGHVGLLDWAGYVGGEALPGELCRAWVFAGPSVYEGGPGFVYLEAMACGLPVVACSGSGASEAVVDGVTGTLVTSGDIDGLTAALERLLGDGRLAREMGAAGRRRVEHEAERGACLQRLAAFYERAVASRRGPLEGGEE